jgi:phospholipid-binding lipoprotein MlaA
MQAPQRRPPTQRRRSDVAMMKIKQWSLALLAGAVGMAHAQSADPLEPYNRAMFGFNEALDAAVMTPLARGYVNVVPELARTGVSNVFGNFGDLWSAVNQLLQGKGEAAATMTMRVATNTLFGIGGLFDVASDLGMERQSEDFGQTLGRWGLPAGPYFVWPVLGPSTIRDTVGRPLDLAWSPSSLTQHELTSYSISGLQLLDARANLLGASRIVDGIALDKYTFIRDAYIVRRRSLVYDGDPPEEPAAPDPAPK